VDHLDGVPDAHDPRLGDVEVEAEVVREGLVELSESSEVPRPAREPGLTSERDGTTYVGWVTTSSTSPTRSVLPTQSCSANGTRSVSSTMLGLNLLTSKSRSLVAFRQCSRVLVVTRWTAAQS
jgi:hypothetical protein